MTLQDLEKRLDKATDDFAAEISGKYGNLEDKPVSDIDINELARQTFYAMREFKSAIIEYLKQI